MVGPLPISLTVLRRSTRLIPIHWPLYGSRWTFSGPKGTIKAGLSNGFGKNSSVSQNLFSWTNCHWSHVNKHHHPTFSIICLLPLYCSHISRLKDQKCQLLAKRFIFSHKQISMRMNTKLLEERDKYITYFKLAVWFLLGMPWFLLSTRNTFIFQFIRGILRI